MDTPDQLSRLQERLNAIQTRLDGTDQNLSELEKSVSSTCAEMLRHSSTIMKSAQEILTKFEALNQDSVKANRAEPEKHDPLWEFLKTLAGAVVIFAVPVYAAGWGFLFRYYTGF